MNDRAAVAAQLQREPRSSVVVAARCHLEVPVVIDVPPHLDDGTPFPTRYWLTCPLAVIRVSRLESAGGVKEAEARIAADAHFAAAHATAAERYARERDERIEPDAPVHRGRGGVGGAMAGVKCLHAHYADHAAGNVNPVGASTAAEIEPLDCTMPCVVAEASQYVRNPEWREPSR